MPKQRQSSRSNRQAGHSSSTKGTSSKSRQPTQAVSLCSPVLGAQGHGRLPPMTSLP